jgi:hypothetical protein
MAAPHFLASRKRTAMGPKMMPIVAAGTVQATIQTRRTILGYNDKLTCFAQVPCCLELDCNQSEEDRKGANDGKDDVQRCQV